MRAISSDLLAKASTLKGIFYASATIANKRLRWASGPWADGAQYPTAQALAPNNTLIRHRNAAGTIAQTTVTTTNYTQGTDGTGGPWAAYTTLWAAAATANSDTALAATATHLRTHFTASGPTIKWSESSDNGTHWSAPATITGPAPTTIHLAAANTILLYNQDGVIRGQTKPLGSGSWSAIANWTALTTTTVTGIAAAWDATASLYRIAVTADGKVYVGTYTPATNTWSAPLQIFPGGSATAASTTNPSWPSICISPASYFISWTDDYSGTPSWTYPTVVKSTDWIHFGDEVAVHLYADEHKRANLTYWPTLRRVFAANENTTCNTMLYDANDTSQNLSGLDVLSYTRKTRPTDSTIEITLLDRKLAYRTLGQVGEPAEPIQTLATLTLSRGYRIPTGDEAQPLDPHYITHAQVNLKPNEGRLVIQAVDGWGLLNLYRPGEPLIWENKTVEWLMAEVLARVGLALEPTVSQDYYTYQIPSFTWLPTQTARAALMGLLTISGSVGRWTQTGTFQPLHLAYWSPLDMPTIGANDEILNGHAAKLNQQANSYRVIGQGAAQAYDAYESMTQGLRIRYTLTDYRLTTNDQCSYVADGLYATLGNQDHDDQVKIPIRPDLELWDKVCLDLPNDIIPPSDWIRRIMGIDETNQPNSARTTQTLYLQNF